MDSILTLVRHPGNAQGHLLLTADQVLKWRKTAALCGVVPPDALGWEAHHSVRLAAVCPVCLLLATTCAVGIAVPHA